jgi:hypothetical protein
MKKYNNYHSSFWLEEHDFDEDIVFSSLSEQSVDTIKKYRLSSARKAISNFVSIATGKNIPVTFATNNSYTDGKSVVISGDIDKAEKFDIGVGLALHEGSHILLSDFELLRNLDSKIPTSLFELAATKNLGRYQVIDMVKNLGNIVEDRRIDNYIYKNAPGYREYYLKLYEHYFGDKAIEKGLESDDFKKENCESYMFRLINLMNKKSDLTSLKGLKEIWKLLDLKNIDRLKNSIDTHNVALEIASVIFTNIDVVENQNNNQSAGQGEPDEQGEGNQQDGDAGDMKGDENETPSSNGPSMSSDADGGNSMSESSEGESSEGESDSNEGKSSNSLSDSALKKLNRIIKQQKEFLDGDVKKKKITKTLENEITSVESQGAEIVHVGEGLHNSKGCDVIVLKNLTKKMLEDDSFGMAYAYQDWKTGKKSLNQVIKSDDFSKAEMMGTVMGKKLQVRNESRNTIFNRQKNGKIDGRMIATLGFDNENVFSQTFVDKFKKANIHLSIDASGSMGGRKWRETMINAIALAKATSMISNLELQITFRYSDNDLPVIVFAYDSRKDSFQKIKSIFPYLKECGTTPEGLTFEAIQKMLVPASNDVDSFFVNISDGEPTFGNRNIQYGGMAACEHTKKQVNKIKANGIGVLSYFVSDNDYYSEGSKTKFKTMYGADARFININSIGEVTTTLNKMFLSK